MGKWYTGGPQGDHRGRSDYGVTIRQPRWRHLPNTRRTGPTSPSQDFRPGKRTPDLSIKGHQPMNSRGCPSSQFGPAMPGASEMQRRCRRHSAGRSSGRDVAIQPPTRTDCKRLTPQTPENVFGRIYFPPGAGDVGLDADGGSGIKITSVRAGNDSGLGKQE